MTMDDILTEVRAISKFDHANIVRYYNSVSSIISRKWGIADYYSGLNGQLGRAWYPARAS